MGRECEKNFLFALITPSFGSVLSFLSSVPGCRSHVPVTPRRDHVAAPLEHVHEALSALISFNQGLLGADTSLLNYCSHKNERLDSPQKNSLLASCPKNPAHVLLAYGRAVQWHTNQHRRAILSIVHVQLDSHTMDEGKSRMRTDTIAADAAAIARMFPSALPPPPQLLHMMLFHTHAQRTQKKSKAKKDVPTGRKHAWPGIKQKARTGGGRREGIQIAKRIIAVVAPPRLLGRTRRSQRGKKGGKEGGGLQRKKIAAPQGLFLLTRKPPDL